MVYYSHLIRNKLYRGIPCLSVAKMPARSGVYSLGVAVCRSRPNNKGVEVLTIHGDTLDCYNQGTLYSSTSIIIEFVLIY